MKDPYQVLGVAREATADQIKLAYRGLARTLHPDLNPGDKKAEERFKEISAAYDFLSDADKKSRYDRGEIDADGTPIRRARAHAGRRNSSFAFGDEADEILEELMRRKERGKRAWGGGGFGDAGGFGGGTYADMDKPGQEARHALSVSFAEAATGATKRVTLATGKSVDVRIPPGSQDGQTLRLKGQGFPGLMGAPAGDAFIEIKVEPHPHFTRRDADILLDLPVTVQEAVMGAKVTVPTVDGKVAVTVPAGSNTGTVLRLKGKGIHVGGHKGDQLVTLKVVLPDDDAEFRKLVEKWGAKAAYDPRAKSGL